MYPGSRSKSVGMSVEPWMLACPRSAMMPPPGRPMLPSSACRIEAVRMYYTPTVCWVQPTLYTKALVRSRPEFSASSSHTRRNGPGGTPQICSTISGVYRAKWRLSIWKTHRGWVSGSSRSGFPAPTAAAAGPVRLPPPRLPDGRGLGPVPVLLVPLSGRGLHLQPLVLPAVGIVEAVLAVQPRENSVQVLGVGEVLVDDHRSVGVG